jgi:MGT family glycosyltransferase
MARLIVFTYPDPSHVLSSLPIFAELVRRGEEVVLYSAASYREVIEATGATFRSYGGTMAASSTGPFGGMRRRIDFAEQILPELIDTLRKDRPDCVMLDAAANWGRIAADVLALPSISYRLTFALHRDMFDAAQLVQRFYTKAPQEFVLQGMLDVVAYYEAAIRVDRQYGSSVADVAKSLECRADLNLVLIARALQIEFERFDESYRFVGPCLSDREEPDTFCWEQLGPDPLIYISLGTVFNDRPQFFSACLDALRDLPVRVVMSVGKRVDRASLGPAPANVLVTSFVQAPIAKMLERAALVIHHAGGNTLQECARAGVPQLMFPQAGDQFMLADLVQAHGAGIRLSSEDIESGRLRELVQKMMNDPGYCLAARALRESVRTSGGTAQACDEILAFIGRLRE